MGSFPIYLLCGKHSMKASHYLNSAFLISFPCVYFIAVHSAASARLSPCVSLHRCSVSIWVNFRFFILISKSPLKRLRHKFFSQKDSYKAIPITHTHIPSQIFPLSNCLFTGRCPTSLSDLQYSSLLFQEEAYYQNDIIKRMVLRINYFFSSERIFSTILNMKNFLKFLLIITGDLWVPFILLPNIPHTPSETGAKTEWMTVLFTTDDLGRSICNYSENWVLIWLYFT